YLTLEIRGSEGHLRVETAPWRLSGLLANGRRVSRSYVAERLAERLFQKVHGCEHSLVRELESLASPPGHPRPGATAWAGCRVTQMVDAVYRSSRSKREILLEPLFVKTPSVRRRGQWVGEGLN